jgi:hypothetical protein
VDEKIQQSNEIRKEDFDNLVKKRQERLETIEKNKIAIKKALKGKSKKELAAMVADLIEETEKLKDFMELLLLESKIYNPPKEEDLQESKE